MSDSLRSHGLQHTRLPCPSLSPGVCSNLCPLSHWCYPTISTSVTPLSSCPQSFPASGSFPMNQFFASGGQSRGASALASVLPMNNQGWFPSVRQEPFQALKGVRLPATNGDSGRDSSSLRLTSWPLGVLRSQLACQWTRPNGRNWEPFFPGLLLTWTTSQSAPTR